MRSVNAGVYFGALWGALLLLCGCTVPSEPPVAGSRSLASLTGLEVVRVCDWARDYMGGEDYKHPESDEEEHTAIHYCPPTEEELGVPEDDERFYFRWDDEFCGDLISLLDSETCSGTVDDFSRVVRKLADAPCVSFSVSLSGGCSYSWQGRDELD
jgi:hypothetical protein